MQRHWTRKQLSVSMLWVWEGSYYTTENSTWRNTSTSWCSNNAEDTKVSFTKWLFQNILESDWHQAIKQRRMKKQSFKKRQQTGSSSHSKKKKQVKKQNSPSKSRNDFFTNDDKTVMNQVDVLFTLPNAHLNCQTCYWEDLHFSILISLVSESSSGQKNTQNKYQLPVTCGYKEGVLYLKKYYDSKCKNVSTCSRFE